MSGAMYLVQRTAFDLYGAACSCQIVGDTGSRVPLRLFVSRAAAEAYCADLLAEARREMDPFLSSGSGVYAGYLEDMDGQKRGLLLETLSLPSLPEDGREWWDDVQDGLSDEQRAAVWEFFVHRPPYEVVEVGVGD